VYHDRVSIKYQITLPDDLSAALKLAAARRGVPLAEYIRETMERDLRKPAPAAKQGHRLASLTGLIDDESDLASRVDEVLYR
jgi:hypothetical protein